MLDPPVSGEQWARGRHAVACRATDVAGTSQPDEPEWNLLGYGMNAVQRVEIVAR